MPLRITLKPFERLIINGASIKNGDRSTDFLMETHCRFLRESEIIHESEADTPAKRLCVTLQAIYLSEKADRPAFEDVFTVQATELMRAAPSMVPHIVAIEDCLSKQQFHRAIKHGKALIAYEAGLLRHALDSHAPGPEAALVA